MPTEGLVNWMGMEPGAAPRRMRAPISAMRRPWRSPLTTTPPTAPCPTTKSQGQNTGCAVDLRMKARDSSVVMVSPFGSRSRPR